jgi:hypothetical protein
MEYFNQYGRRVPTEKMRVFAREPSFYYSLKNPANNLRDIYERLSASGIAVGLSQDDFIGRIENLHETIKADNNYSNLLNGVAVPFAISALPDYLDLGGHLEHELLPKVESSFKNAFPDRHFKAVLQGDSDLEGHISIDSNSRYESLISSAKIEPVVGIYFPQALQEFDVDSQRNQMAELPGMESAAVCLSGGVDICAALIGTPSLLINEETYAPILCMSAYRHADPRLILLMKSYGPHLEFWCMTQMLTKDVTQVSEQWAGGITIFK